MKAGLHVLLLHFPGAGPDRAEANKIIKWPGYIKTSRSIEYLQQNHFRGTNGLAKKKEKLQEEFTAT